MTITGLRLNCKPAGVHTFSHPVYITLKLITCHGVKSTLSHHEVTRLFFCNSVQCLFPATTADHFSHCISRQLSAEPALQRQNKSGEKLIFFPSSCKGLWPIWVGIHSCYCQIIRLEGEVQIKTTARFVPKLFIFTSFNSPHTETNSSAGYSPFIYRNAHVQRHNQCSNMSYCVNTKERKQYYVKWYIYLVEVVTKRHINKFFSQSCAKNTDRKKKHLTLDLFQSDT